MRGGGDAMKRLPPKPRYACKIVFLDRKWERHEVVATAQSMKKAIKTLTSTLQRDYPPKNGYLTISYEEFILPRQVKP